MKVREKYNIDEYQLELLAQKGKSDYFAKSLTFYRDMKDKDVGRLTKKQEDWLLSISNIMDNIRAKNVSRPISNKKTKFALIPRKINGRWVWLEKY